MGHGRVATDSQGIFGVFGTVRTRFSASFAVCSVGVTILGEARQVSFVQYLRVRTVCTLEFSLCWDMYDTLIVHLLFCY